MKAQELSKRIDSALKKLSDELAAGRSENLQTYLAAMGKFHHYSLGNALLIISQRPDATYVAGYRRWQELNRFVRKGEKGISIRAPLVRTNEETGDSDVRFRAISVFDVSQTDGEPLPELARPQGDPGNSGDALREFARRHDISIEYSEEIAPSLGRSEGGTILLLPGLSPSEEFSVLCHEVAHELLHHHGAKPSKTVRETEAEAVSFAVLHELGLDVSTTASDYIQMYQGDTETLLASLTRVQKTASAILSGIDEISQERAVVEEEDLQHSQNLTR